MDFVIVSAPGQRPSAKTTRRVHSHAARAAHTRARRLRMAEHMKDKPTTKDGPPIITTAEANPDLIRSLEMVLTSVSIPPTLDGNFESDPITLFRQILSPREHFMLNHSTDAIILRGLLLVACRHLSLVGMQDEYTQLAMRYKLQYLRNLQSCILTEDLAMRREAIAMTTVLALDEMACGNHPMAAKHVLGAAKMIEAAGGIDKLGLNEVVRYSLCALLYGKRLLDWDPDLYLTTSVLTPDSILG
ncbi:hypothetical protein FHETE_4678 [Fusarium heterosporum]|uniref:Uncharacterized protein n=1 Tax=Fusarium heterosporum TaxID=42747 RepID=A0A8H5WT36_FUSHE|nr:hypothetical protein FHETE_4678 [Fusarium heterosporum]